MRRHVKIPLVLGTLAAAAAAVAAVSPPMLVADVNATPAMIQDSNPTVFAGFGTGVLFQACLPATTGCELYFSDFTQAGTRLVMDVAPGTLPGGPSSLAVVGSKAFFPSLGGGGQPIPFVTDGSEAGTVAIAPAGTTMDGDFVVLGSAAYAVLRVAGVDGLWRADGTAITRVGTVSPTALALANGKLYFHGNSTMTGAGPWVSDGTDAGSHPLSTFSPNVGLSQEFVAAGTKVFFRHQPDSSSPATELWVTDDTPAGTVRVTPAGVELRSPRVLTAMGSTLYFFASQDAESHYALWKSDGTPAGTSLVKDLNPGFTADLASAPQQSDIEVAGSTLFISMPKLPSNVHPLWKSDGTPAGTTVLLDDVSGGINWLTALGDLVFLAGGDGTLWESDGTVAGTVTMASVMMTRTLTAGRLSRVGGQILFGGASTNDVAGREPWFTDGTAAGTRRFANIGLESGATGRSRPFEFSEVPGAALFMASAFPQDGTQLFRTDGTAAGTTQLTNYPVSMLDTPGRRFGTAGGRRFFQASTPETGDEPWVSDGTPAGTHMLKDINPGPASSAPVTFAALGGTIFFGASDGVTGNELWKSDGTEAGTVMLGDVIPGAGGVTPRTLTAVGNRLYFRSSSRTAWTSDGTAAGTIELTTEVPPGFGQTYSNFVELGGVAYFGAWDSAHGMELWRSDGTPAGTTRVTDLEPGTTSSNPVGLTVLGNRVIFFADTSAYGRELWASDGTEAGTQLLMDIRPGTSGGPRPSDAINNITPSLATSGGLVFFAAKDATHGMEPWVSDGTTAGTRMLKDIIADTGEGDPYEFSDFFGTVYFTANTAAAGYELWKTDGTEAGTVMVADLMPGPTTSYAFNFETVGTSLYFAATSPLVGEEPHVITCSPPARLVLAGPMTAMAGTPVTLVATPQDTDGAVTRCHLGAANVTSNDPGATLPAAVSFGRPSGSTNVAVTLTLAGQRTVTVTDTTNSTLTASAALTVSAGPASASATTLTAAPTTLPADGNPATISAMVLDAFGNVITDATVTMTATLGVLSAVTNNNDGTYAALLTSSMPGVSTLSATLGGAAISSMATVTFTAPVVMDAGIPDAAVDADAAVVVDAAVEMDASVAVDAGVIADAAVVVDAAVVADAAVGADAAVVVDAAVVADAAVTADAAVVADAAVRVDASVLADASVTQPGADAGEAGGGDDTECGCSVAGRKADPAGAVALMMMVPLLLRRRRR